MPVAWCRTAAEHELHSALGMFAGLHLQPPEGPGAPGEPPGCAAANANTAERSTTPRDIKSLTFEQLHLEAASLSAGLVPASCAEQSKPQGAMQALLDCHPLAPAWARAQALQAWAALEDGSSCAGSKVAGSRCSSSAGRPSSAVASGCSTSHLLAGRPLDAGRSTCSSASRSLRAGQRRCTEPGAVTPAVAPADGGMKGRRSEPSFCVTTEHGNEAEASCSIDAQKNSGDRPTAVQQATACTAGGPSIACGPDGPPKQAWSAEEDAWMAHAQWMAAHADGADGRRAAWHLLALLLPHRSSAELLARWRWCGHTLWSREAQHLGSKHPLRDICIPQEFLLWHMQALLSYAYAIPHLLPCNACYSAQ